MSLNEKIRRILFEDVWNKYGSEYMSHPIDQEPPITIQPELPIVPSAQANMQLTDTAPPVDDESYIPVNNIDLSNALAALALKVPDGFVENLYRQIRDAVNQAEMLGDPQAQGEDVPSTEDFEEEFGTEESMDTEISERFKRVIQKLVAESKDDDDLSLSDWSGGAPYGARDEYDDDDPADWDDEEIPESERPPDTIQGKYLAQYWRERPGKDPSKFKGSGESTMVNATGRLLQNVVKPLLDVPKDQLSDATEYLRLQFRVLAKDREDIPKEAPRTFAGMYIKKLVPKLKEDELGANFLQTVVTSFKGKNDKWLSDLANAAFEEVKSEKAANAKLRATLEKEAPAQAELMDALGG